MPNLPEINLDDRTFQDLVSEARTRITQTCPEWTEHNVSDPGITLIELFAWMTEQTIFRLNRLPEKLHLALLDLLDIRLDPAVAARALLRFRLVAPAEEPLYLPVGQTEVGTPRTASDESIVFQTTEDFTIEPLRPAAYVLTRADGASVKIAVADGVARPSGTEQLAFSDPPVPGDALHLGFDGTIGRLVLRVDVEASQARGAGVEPSDPPLRWEVSSPDGGWDRATVLFDLTGGFNYGSGSVELQLPPRSAARPIGGKHLHWLRCRIAERTVSSDAAAAYAHPPEIYEITAGAIGAAVPAAHSVRVDREVLGVSDGTPRQSFPLRFSPVLPLEGDETVEARNPRTGEWIAWEPRESFATSGPDDRHFAIDLVAGQVEFGPAIRERSGDWTQYGAIPPKGSTLRVTGYRHGGGRRGNVAPNTLTMLKSALAGIDSVTNPQAATGGVDAESLLSARQRAAMEIRTRYRAVTAEDFEFLAREASPQVARARCLASQDGGRVALHLLPVIDPADRQLSYEELMPDDALMERVASYLDERRTIGTTVDLQPVPLRGVSVVADLLTAPTANVQRVQEDVAHALYTYLNPVIGGSTTGPGPGWPFGRPLNQGELYGVIHAIAGVEFVRVLRIYESDVRTGAQEPKPAGSHLVLEPDELLASGRHIVKATRREA
jgi:predicted phage baseplate assembly protein